MSCIFFVVVVLLFTIIIIVVLLFTIIIIVVLLFTIIIIVVVLLFTIIIVIVLLLFTIIIAFVFIAITIVIVIVFIIVVTIIIIVVTVIITIIIFIVDVIIIRLVVVDVFAAVGVESNPPRPLSMVRRILTDGYYVCPFASRTTPPRKGENSIVLRYSTRKNVGRNLLVRSALTERATTYQ